MPNFAFTARTRQGRLQKGNLEAPNSDEALSVLQARELIVVSIQESSAPGPATIGGRTRVYRRAKPQDLIVFARSMAAMTEAGLPLLKALEIVGTQSKSQRLKSIVTEVVKDIRGGSTLRDALAKHPKVFTPFWVSLVETGEASGQLSKALEQIAIHLEKTEAVKRKVVSAMIYPVILVMVGIGAILFFLLFIIPQFESLYSSFGGKLPGLTRMVLALSRGFTRYFPIIIAGSIAAGFLLSRYFQTEVGKLWLDRTKLRMPALGPLFQAISAQEVTANLSTLLKAGVPILHALDIVVAATPNKVVASVVEHMRTSAREGRPLAEPLTKTDVFPPMVAQMIAVGEQTGKLPSMLEEAATYYEEQVGTMVERLMTLLEPAMLIGMGVVIGLLVVAMYLPVLTLSSAMGGG